MIASAAVTPAVRNATADDRTAVEALLTAHDLPVAGVAEMFAQDPSQFVVATVGDALVAVAGVETHGAHALLRSVAVQHDWQQRGLGRALVAHAVERAEARGVAALYLLTMTAERYFPRFGFAPVTREKVPAGIRETVEFTSACPASAVVMCKSLTGEA